MDRPTIQYARAARDFRGMPKSFCKTFVKDRVVRLSQATQPKWSRASNAADFTAWTKASPSFLRSTQVTSAPRATGRPLSSSYPASRST